MSNKVLIVEDDATISEYISDYLIKNNYQTECCHNICDAKNMIQSDSFDIILLDINLPDGSGFEILENNNETPTIVISALGDVDDKIVGLTKGAKDYIAKPFDPRELLLRIENILESNNKKSILFGPYRYDFSSKQLYNKNSEIHLTSAERNVLNILCLANSSVVSRQELQKTLGIYVNDRTIDTTIARLRAKIETDPKKPQLIKTERHKGYFLVSSSQA